MEYKTVTARELIERQLRGMAVNIVDVRTPAEFRAAHAKGARLVPLEALDGEAVSASHAGGEQPVYVICQTGGRARKACERLAEAGVLNAVVVEGGTAAWEEAGGPVERGRSVMSLERQVRIAAGSFVLMGLVLAFMLTPWFSLLSAFVGAGLVFSGITDTCGMGLLLARMPWNQMRGKNSCAQSGASRTG